MSRAIPLPLVRLLGVLAMCSTAQALTFSEWQSVHFNAGQLADPALIAPSADPDGDGLSNLAEYAFTGDPLFGDSNLLPIGGQSGDHLTLTYRERTDLSGTEVWMLGSDDLLYWATFNSLEEIARVNGTGYSDITLRDPFPISPKRFLRLRLLLTPLPPLQAPGNFGVAVENSDNVRLRWSDWNVTETGYAVEKFSLVSQSWERVTVLAADVTTWLDDSLAGYSGIRYRVVTLSPDLELPSEEATVPATNGVPDWWLLKHFGFIGADLFTDLNANGADSYNDYLEGTDPIFDFYQGNPPTLTEISGGGQTGLRGAYLPQPWIIRVSDSSGQPIPNAPVRFVVDQGELSPDPNITVSGYPRRVVYTDADGYARIYWKL